MIFTYACMWHPWKCYFLMNSYCYIHLMKSRNIFVLYVKYLNIQMINMTTFTTSILTKKEDYNNRQLRWQTFQWAFEGKYYHMELYETISIDIQVFLLYDIPAGSICIIDIILNYKSGTWLLLNKVGFWFSFLSFFLFWF